MKFLKVLLLAAPLSTSIISKPADQIWFNGITSDDLSERGYIRNVSSSITDTKVEVVVDYYVNTRESTYAIFTTNGKTTTASYTDKTSTQKWDQLKIDFKTNEASPRLRFDFVIKTIRDELSTSGEFNYDSGTRDVTRINSQGKYTYDFVKGVSFNQKSAQFSYTKNQITFDYLIPKVSNYLSVKNPIDIKGENITYSNVIVYKNQRFPLVSNLIPEGLKNSGKYTLETTINYSYGISNKTLILNYEYEVLKDYIGECASAVLCVDKDKELGGNGDEIYETTV